MATDWAADVKRYVPEADTGVIAGIVRYCGIALRNRDSSLVSMSDPKETARVRENFLKKKLALTAADSVLDAGIAAVGKQMKADNFKNRVTVYYLLAQHFDKLGTFAKAAPASKAAKVAKAPAKKPKATKAAAAGTSALGLADLGAGKAAAKPAAKATAKKAAAPKPKAEAAPKAAVETKPKAAPIAKPVAAAKAAPATKTKATPTAKAKATSVAKAKPAPAAKAKPAATKPKAASAKPKPAATPKPKVGATKAAGTATVAAVSTPTPAPAPSKPMAAMSAPADVKTTVRPVTGPGSTEEKVGGLGWLWWVVGGLLLAFLLWWLFLR